MLKIKDIEKKFKEKDVSYSLQDDIIFYTHHTEKEKVRMNTMCRCDNTTFTLTVYSLNVGEKTPAIQQAIEEANRNYKYWKFSVDKDNDLCMEYQALCEYLNDAEIYIDMLLIAANIIDDFYPQIQKARFSASSPTYIESDLD